MGGSGDESANGVAVDQTGAAFVAGTTSSTDMPVTPGLQTFPVGHSAGFVISMDPVGTIRFLRYLGGDKHIDDYDKPASEGVNAIAVDAQSNIYLAGETISFEFPFGLGGAFPFKTDSNADTRYGFVISLDAQLHPRWGTYWGSPGSYFTSTYLKAIAVNDVGEVYFGGFTYSDNLPFLPPAAAFPSAGFVVKLTNNGQFKNGGYTMRLGASVDGIAAFVSNQSAPFEPPGPHQQVYCTGVQYTDGPNDTTDVFVAKLDEGVSVVKGPPIF